jgi:hypothetical protein
MNKCIFLPEDIKNIIIEYTLPPKRWIIKNKKEIARIFDVSLDNLHFFGYVYVIPYDGKLNTTKEIFYNILCAELSIISESIRRLKHLEIDRLTSKYQQDLTGHFKYSVYIHNHIYEIIALKYM